ncbi:MAG: S9 family peptidase [Candidatus Aminicenantes bacterium]|nr:S9 family peptidase [Candidatus Aminicenantes bacterium]
MKNIGKKHCFILMAFLVILNLSAVSGGAKGVEREAMFYKYLGFAGMVKGGHIDAHWMEDGNSFWYAEGEPANVVIHKVDPVANTKKPLFDTEKLRASLTTVLGHEPPYKGLPFTTFSFLDQGETAISFAVEKRDFICSLEDYSVTAAPVLSDAERERTIPRFLRKGMMDGLPPVMETLSPDGKWFLGTKDFNLYLRSTYDGRIEPLTCDGAEFQEWDIQVGFWPEKSLNWSPDSLRVVAAKIDSNGVHRLPVVHWLKQKEEVEWIPYPKTGGKTPLTELYFVDIHSGKRVRIDTGDDPNQNLAAVGWLPDGSEYIFARTDRPLKKLQLMAADPEEGNSRIILTETSDTFLSSTWSANIKFIEGGTKFLWLAERDNWAHIYFYDLQGNLIRRLTRGSFPVVRVVAVDEEEGWIYFTAHAESRLYDTHLYRVDMQGKNFERLTEAQGQHDLSIYLSLLGMLKGEGVRFSPSMEYFLDSHSSTDRAPATELRKADGTLVRIISEANIDALQAIKWSSPEEFIVKADDGQTNIYGILYKPYDFDPGKKYPVIDNIYNGPQTTWVPRTFSDARLVSAQALAQLGFIVFQVDGRGTTDREKEFQDVVYRNFGRNEIPDHVAALRQLAAERPYMDLDRVGIYGASFGGYMTLRAMLLAPDVYHVAVSSAPVVDLYDIGAGSAEAYMGLIEDNREGYEYASSLDKAGNLRGKLLLIHGTNDVNAPFSATMKMVEALVRAGRPFDLVVLPEQSHWVRGKSALFMLEAQRKYFQEHLKPENN